MNEHSTADGRSRGTAARGIRAACATVALGAVVAACGGPAASQSAVSIAPSSAAWPGASATAGRSGADATSPGASACATPPPLAPAGVCAAPSTEPDASGGAGAASAAPGGASPAAPAGAASATPGGASPAVTSAPVAAAAGGASPSPSPAAAGSSPTPAPTSPVGFRVRGTVVPMGFPLPSAAAYRYGDAWRAPRVGVVRPYEQIRGVAPDGTYLRAHDGIDILVKLGTPVSAPWSGTVIDPAKRWKPWDPGRYGKVVAIESDEPTSPGYVVILAHLSTQAVRVGDHVDRGQLVGKTGKTGNAAGTPPHLHLEIHAPFLLRYGYAGVIRRLDVFDAGPSVRAADPRTR